MNSNDVDTLLKMLIPFFVFIILLFVYFFYKNRKRKNVDFKHVKSIDSISIDLTETLRSEYESKTKWIKIIPPIIIFFIYIFILGMMILGEGPGGLAAAFDPSTILFKINLFLLVLMSIGGLLGYLRTKDSINHMINAYQISLKTKLVFSIDHQMITVPTLMLCNPALWRASEKNMAHLSIPLEDINSLEVYAGSGQSPDQYKMLTKGETSQYGLGRLGNSDAFNFGICVKRAYLKNHETQILKLLQTHLGEKLTIKDDI